MNHLVDTHAHLLKEYYKDMKISEIIELSISYNVKRIISISTNYSNIEEVVTSICKYKEVFAAIGIHPQTVNETMKKHPLVAPLIEEKLKLPKVVAIGEIGFDFYREKGEGYVNNQKVFFHQQMKLAEKWNLPVIIHSRAATKTTMNAIAAYPNIRKVIHCFSEGLEIMNQYLRIPNVWISFTGIVTFKNAKNVQEAFKECPLERLMLETDCPYLAPTPNRGKINIPAYVKHICKIGSELKGISFNKLQDFTTTNAYRFFKKLY